MTYIDLRGVTLTVEMKQWINKEAQYSKWHLGEFEPRNGMWKQYKERLGVWLDGEDAIVFKLLFGI